MEYHKLTAEDIKFINSKVNDPWNEGVYSEANGLPVHIKEHVIYMRWDSHGYSGGNCWNDSNPQYYKHDKPEFTVIDTVLELVCPKITYLQYKKIEGLIRDTEERAGHEYYGNSTIYAIEYIVLSELYELLDKM